MQQFVEFAVDRPAENTSGGAEAISVLLEFGRVSLFAVLYTLVSVGERQESADDCKRARHGGSRVS